MYMYMPVYVNVCVYIYVTLLCLFFVYLDVVVFGLNVMSTCVWVYICFCFVYISVYVCLSLCTYLCVYICVSGVPLPPAGQWLLPALWLLPCGLLLPVMWPREWPVPVSGWCDWPTVQHVRQPLRWSHTEGLRRWDRGDSSPPTCDLLFLFSSHVFSLIFSVLLWFTHFPAVRLFLSQKHLPLVKPLSSQTSMRFSLPSYTGFILIHTVFSPVSHSLC